MNLELDHFFIITAPGAQVAEHLLALGIKEGPRNHHPGQGTANRRFFFENMMLELLYIQNPREAMEGRAKQLRFVQRADLQACPFGLILHRSDNATEEFPFEGWPYQPEYFPEPLAFHIGANSDLLYEPLCIYVPFVDPEAPAPMKVELDDTQLNKKPFQSITQVTIRVKARILSKELHSVALVNKLSIHCSDTHLMELEFNHKKRQCSVDLRPALPLILHY